jgi:hypothetical protein
MLRHLYKVSALLFFTQFVFGQSLDPTICIDRLEEAKRSYRAGLLNDVKVKIV